MLLTLILAWISNHKPRNVSVTFITYPFPNNSWTVEVWIWISNFLTHPTKNTASHSGASNYCNYFDGLMQERRNSSALVMELRLSCTNPSTLSTTMPCKQQPIHRWIRNLLSNGLIGNKVLHKMVLKKPTLECAGLGHLTAWVGLFCTKV